MILALELGDGNFLVFMLPHQMRIIIILSRDRASTLNHREDDHDEKDRPLPNLETGPERMLPRRILSALRDVSRRHRRFYDPLAPRGIAHNQRNVDQRPAKLQEQRGFCSSREHELAGSKPAAALKQKEFRHPMPL
jgi:hypothetical protein